MFTLRAWLVIAGLIIALGLSAAAATSVTGPESSQVPLADEARLVEEVTHQIDELNNHEFLVPHVLTPDGPTRFALFVAPSEEEHVIALWLATAQGTVAIELRDPAGHLLRSWRGARYEERLEQKLAPGKYVLTLQAVDGAQVHGAIGIKGPAAHCPSDDNRMTEQPADPPRYFWPYLLVKPRGLAADAPASTHGGTLFVEPNNTGFENKDIEYLRASAICELRFGLDTGPLAIADGLGAPLLMPLFPRLKQRYLQALSRASLEDGTSSKFNRVDKQLVAMIDDARAKLASMNHPVGKRVLMAGFSASGVFTNRFAVLHPERALAAAVGGPGGWPIAPVAADQGETLPYPVGIADLDDAKLGGQAVDLAALQRVRFLFLLGDADTNDATRCLDSFSRAQADLINRLFGTVSSKCEGPSGPTFKFWWHAQRLYAAAGLNARFRVYPGVTHKMGMTPVMWNDVLHTFRKALAAP